MYFKGLSDDDTNIHNCQFDMRSAKGGLLFVTNE